MTPSVCNTKPPACALFSLPSPTVPTDTAHSAREIALLGVRALNSPEGVSPSDIEQWYERAHGPLPVDPATLRGAMSREAAKREGELERAGYGTYRLRESPTPASRQSASQPARPGYRTLAEYDAEQEAAPPPAPQPEVTPHVKVVELCDDQGEPFAYRVITHLQWRVPYRATVLPDGSETPITLPSPA